MIKLVAFDLDNTLYDYDMCNRASESALFYELTHQFKVDKAYGKELLKNAKKYVKNLLGNTAASHNRLLYMQNICEQLGVNPVVYARTLYDIYWNTFLSEMKLFDYVLPLFEDLKRNEIHIGILTDLTAYIQYRKIERLDIGDYINYLVTSEEVGEEKPSAKMFDCLMKKSGCGPDNIIMIGDDEKRDIIGAVNCDIHAIKYVPGLDIRAEVRKVYEADSGCSML